MSRLRDHDIHPDRRQLSSRSSRYSRARDEAKVEVGVLVVERWILARLRHQWFFCVAPVKGTMRGTWHRAAR
jgi:hypothetical protein